MNVTPVPLLIRKILVPVDFSGLAFNTVNYSAALAQNLNAEIVLFHVNEVPATMYGEPAVVLDYRSVSTGIIQELEKLKDSVNTSFNLNNIKTLSIPGFALDEIQAETISDKIDLIIIGSNTKSGNHNYLFDDGSLPSEVIKQALCPVLSVPSDAEFKIPRKVVIQTEYENKDINVLLKIISTLKTLGTEEVFIFNQANSDEQAVISFQKILMENSTSIRINFHSSITGDMEDAIGKFVKKNGIDWVCTNIKKKSFLSQLFHKDLTAEIASHSDVPVIAFHSEAADL